jgi:hypothetical protein
MQILFNELSLVGQFSDANVFVNTGLLPFIGVLREMQGFSTLLLKKSDVWSRLVTQSTTLHAILIGDTLRTFDEVRRLKSAIADLTKEPFWDNDSKQEPTYAYILAGLDIRGSSPAEACERDKILASFIASPRSVNPLCVEKNGVLNQLLNLTRTGELTEHLWSTNQISFEDYLKCRFSTGKLDFSRVDEKMGFEGIQKTEQDLFVDTFRKFNEQTWDQIYSNKGLDYKEYRDNVGTQYRGMKTYKFRASQKIRCHGYRERDRFVVIGFETDHKLSNRG